MSSSITLRIRQATGLRSLAKASQPSRRASNGIGAAAGEGVHDQRRLLGVGGLDQPRPVSKYSSLAALSQLAKSAMNLSSVFRSPSSVLTAEFHPEGRSRIARSSSLALDLNSSGQWGSQGSGSSRAISTARDDARGRLAHQRCRVEGCPCRMDFSRAAWRDTSAMGKSTSARRLHSLGIME